MGTATLNTEQQRAFDAVYFAIGKLRTAMHENKAELSDLRPPFWAALTQLAREAEMCVDAADPIAQIKAALVKASKQLGAPGDFGYGTPHGQALRNLYVAWRALPKGA